MYKKGTLPVIMAHIALDKLLGCDLSEEEREKVKEVIKVLERET